MVYYMTLNKYGFRAHHPLLELTRWAALFFREL